MVRPYFSDEMRSALENSRWLVTGCAGFIGSHCVDALLDIGAEVVGVDNFSTGLPSNIDFLQAHPKANRFSFVESDINDASKWGDLLCGTQGILHQAALGSVPRSIESPLHTLRNNVAGFTQLLDAARLNGVQRFIYASSSSVFGDSEELPKQEGAEGQVLSPYAASKRINEILAESYANAYGMSVVGLRYFNVFGARQDPKGPYAAVIPRWLQCMQDGEVCEIYGDGETSRDFCFVDNAVQANLRALTAPLEAGQAEVLNVACGGAATLNEVHAKLASHYTKLTGKDVPPARYGDFRAGDVRHSLADIKRATEVIGYKPGVLFDEGVERCVEAFLAQKGKNG